MLRSVNINSNLSSVCCTESDQSDNSWDIVVIVSCLNVGGKQRLSCEAVTAASCLLDTQSVDTQHSGHFGQS